MRVPDSGEDAVGPAAHTGRTGMPHGDITHIDIPVTDLDQAQRFYSELFG